MRIVNLIVLLLMLAAVIIFAVQNVEMVTVRFLGQAISLPRALLIVIAYVMGMLSGWMVVGFIQRSIQRTRQPERKD